MTNHRLQVRPLVEVARPETDAALAEQATHWSAKQVRELALAARKESDERAAGSYARRFRAPSTIADGALPGCCPTTTTPW